MKLPGTNISHLDSAGGLTAFCFDCHRAVDTIEIEVGKLCYQVCEDCVISHLVNNNIKLGESRAAQ